MSIDVHTPLNVILRPVVTSLTGFWLSVTDRSASRDLYNVSSRQFHTTSVGQGWANALLNGAFV